MSEISRVALFGKLDRLAYKAIEGATVFCRLRGNSFVELEHWLVQILETTDSDLHRIMRHFALDASVVARDLTLALDRLPRGASAVSDLSEHLCNAVERGWVYASLMYGAPSIRTGHLLLGMLKTNSLRNALFTMSRQFERIRCDELADALHAIVSGSPEGDAVANSAAEAGALPGGADAGIAPAQLGKEEALQRYTVDLTGKAAKGELDPVSGRDDEVRQIVDILMRRRQNNPILTGEAGVGKTAVVEGLAQRIVRGDVPPALRNVRLLSLDIGLLQAGASMKGEFEQRLRHVIDEVQASPKPVVLFIDEVHTLVGAGGPAGTGDAANLIKPALARGDLRTIGATTWSEYKKHIEKDPALTRRFQVVQVKEPDEETANVMLRGIASRLEQHHRVQLLDEAIEAAVRLSHRYIPARQLPDKAVSLLDTACARVAISQHAIPAEVESWRRRIEALDVEIDIIEREASIGLDVTARSGRVRAEREAASEQLTQVEARWGEEKRIVERILALRAQLREGGKSVDTRQDNVPEACAQRVAQDAARTSLLGELSELQAQLSAAQGECPMIMPTVDAQVIASVVADWTGIPVGRMVKNEVEAILNLAGTLEQRIFGQGHALEMIVRRIQTSRAGLDNPEKPVGVFMLAGTSGVGKTETAHALAEALYGGEHNVIAINMSEFQEAHTVSSLKGAPPGYVGYGEGGVLTEAVRHRPYSVVLLDEFEKAHPDVHELFFQVFDKGWMADGEGRVIDFKNTLILLTTNVGTELIARLCRDPARTPDPRAIADALREPLLDAFPPALLGRLVVIPYYPLNDRMIDAIARLQLGRIARRIRSNHKVGFSYSDAVIELIATRCTENESGGRMIDAILTNTLLPRISREFLQRMAEGRRVEQVRVGVSEGDFVYAFD